MTYEAQCPKGHRLQVTEAHFRQTVSCPTCNTPFVVPDLGAAAHPAPHPAAHPAAAPVIDAPLLSKPRRKISLGNWSDLAGKYGRAMLAVGLILVLFSRGCDVIGQRSVERAETKPEMAFNQFSDKWETKGLDIKKQLDALENKKTADPDDKDKKSKLQDQLTELGKDFDKARKDFEASTMRDLRISARDADASNQLWGYWREIAFVSATVLLVLGLLAVSWSAQGAERAVCLIMMAIIAFSIFIGGIAWIPVLRSSIG
jgi:hypothetical protein